MNVVSTKVLIEDTIYTSLLETGPPFDVVIWSTRRSNLVPRAFPLSPGDEVGEGLDISGLSVLRLESVLGLTLTLTLTFKQH